MKTRKDVDACKCTEHGEKECLGNTESYNPHMKDETCTCIDEHNCGKSNKNNPRLKPQHTPTPWKTMTLNPYIFSGEEPEEIAVARFDMKLPLDQQKANAAFIVKAVNCHEELLEAAKSMQAEIRRRVGFTATAWDEAIAKAEGK